MARAPWQPLCRLLPFDYPDRLARAAEVGDMATVDAITDELARRYPRWVRPRDDGTRFCSTAPMLPAGQLRRAA